jgi:hypothetical protein
MNLVGHNCMPEHVVSIQVSICLGLKIKEKSLNLKFKPNQTYISFKHYNYPVRYYWSIVATTVTLGVSQSPPPSKEILTQDLEGEHSTSEIRVARTNNRTFPH